MARGVGQRVGIEAGVVGQRMVFEIVPGVFDGIEFRGIRRQHDEVDGAGVGHEPLDEPGTMGLEPIPDDDHRGGGGVGEVGARTRRQLQVGELVYVSTGYS